MTKRLQQIGWLLAAGVGLAACEKTDRDILAVDATGAVAVAVFLDRNGNDQFDPAVDSRARGVTIRLVTRGSQTAAASAVTDTGGVALIQSVPVGRYDIRVDTTTIGDSVRVARLDSAQITALPADTVATQLVLSFPRITTAAARASAPNRRVFVDGIALHTPGIFGDSTLHIQDATGRLRAARVTGPAVSAGDSVRLLGLTGTRLGQPALLGAAISLLRAAAQTLEPTPVLTSAAGTANGGALDAALVRIASATILNLQTQLNGDLLLNVDDGSGPLEVVLSRQGGFSTSAFSPGALLDATGVLIPLGTGRFQLKPRSPSDLALNFERVTIAQARRLPVGRRVMIEGLALYGWATFGDASVHIVDPTGSLRASAVAQAQLFEGDSVRLVGTLVIAGGQIQLNTVTPFVLARGRTLPPPTVVTTKVAASADSARLDAALVRVDTAKIDSVAVVASGSGAGTVFLAVNDGSGSLIVELDPDVGIVAADFVTGTSIVVTGVLVPTAGGATWILRPRKRDDIRRLSP
jgi:hypothetical protein